MTTTTYEPGQTIHDRNVPYIVVSVEPTERGPFMTVRSPKGKRLHVATHYRDEPLRVTKVYW